MIVAQITDLHIGTEGSLAYGRYDTSASLSRCIAYLLRQRPAPELVLATGDLVDAGSEGEYRRLKELLLPLPMPLISSPGITMIATHCEACSPIMRTSGPSASRRAIASKGIRCG